MTMPEKPEWDDRDEQQYDLVMPFLNVVSRGGKYEDEPFTAGWQMGEIMSALRERRIAATSYLVFSDLAEQVDLIAMKYDYTTDILHDDGTWAQIGVTRNDAPNLPQSLACPTCNHPLNEHFGDNYVGCVLCEGGLCNAGSTH